MGVSKVVFGKRVIIDITDSTISSGDLRDGSVAYNAAGERIIGDMSTDIVVTDFTGTVTLILDDDYKLDIG